MHVIQEEPNKKLVSFKGDDFEMDLVQNEIDQGWSITNLINYNSKYICVLERVSPVSKEKPYLHIPRKRIKLMR